MNCTECQTPLNPGFAKCPRCKHWNTGFAKAADLPSKWLSEVTDYDYEYLESGPWDPVFGKSTTDLKGTPSVGIVPGTVYLLGGGEGAGKSTLFLQIASAIAGYKEPVLYVA